MKKWKKIIVATLLISMVQISFGPQNKTMAAPKINENAFVSADIFLGYDSENFSDKYIKIYKIADVKENGNAHLAGDFSKYNIDINNVNEASKWNDIAYTLESYIIADGINYDFQAKTNTDGRIKYEAKGAGLYLVMTDKIEKDGRIYEAAPQIIALPNLNDMDEWIYNISIELKVKEILPDHERNIYKIVKKWDDEGKEKERPDNISIKIYQNGRYKHTQKLSDENNWSYFLETENDGSVWTVIENNVPGKYNVLSSKSANIITITNSIKEKNRNKKGTGLNDINETKLPQTGQKWWPVIILSISGIILLLISRLIYK